MKTLNRPMFRYGGPIKEGIMDGMKEKQAINTVGSPLAPQGSDGRQQYAFPLLAGLGMAGLRMAARPFGQFVMKRAIPYASRVKYRPSSMGSGPGGFERGKTLLKRGQVFEPNKFGQAFINDPLAKSVMTGSNFAGRGIKTGGKGIYNVAKYATTTPSGLTFLGAPVAYQAGKYFLSDGTEIKGDDIKNIKQEGPPGGGETALGTREAYLTPKEEKLSDEKKDQLVSDRIEANRKRYYKLMGIDKMNKESVYDSLIDASKIIQQEGGDLKGAIKSGSLQSQLIGAISKNLDKSSDLKKQIDAAILKGEITKDINLSDPTKQADLAYKKVATEKIQKDLSGGSLIDNILVGAKASGGTNSTSNVYNSVLKTYKTQPIVLADTAETIKLRKGDDYTNDTSLVKEIVDAQNKGPGIYIIDKTAVYIDEQGNASTLFQG